MAARPKRLTRLALVVLLALAAIGAAPQGDGAPKRIVSLVPALTEMLFAFGAGPQVVGVSSYDSFPPEVKSLPRVGALIDPDMERILSLRPDLVITYGSQTDVQAQLARAKIRAFSYRHADLDGVLSTIRDLGTSVGRASESNRLARDIQGRLDAIRTRVAKLRRPRTLLVFERDPGSLRGVYASGGFGFMHDILGVAGGTNVFADTSREAVQPSVETILARAPEVILEVRPTGVATADVAKERHAWDALPSIPAVRTGRVYIATDEYLAVPGPRVAQAAEAIARILHPEAFK
ncbi:MAG TPA: helical backbone metal receptor [Vicinamibacterales bacterium]|jgi:iron complex transport system substrate-binding protein